jgi:hypothetical protein
MHEMQITQDGTIIFIAYFNIPWNCTQWGGAEDGLLMDSGFQEVDPATNELLFNWSASPWFDVNDTHARYSPAFSVSNASGRGFFHINSVQKVRLVSPVACIATSLGAANVLTHME